MLADTDFCRCCYAAARTQSCRWILGGHWGWCRGITQNATNGRIGDRFTNLVSEHKFFATPWAADRFSDQVHAATQLVPTRASAGDSIVFLVFHLIIPRVNCGTPFTPFSTPASEAGFDRIMGAGQFVSDWLCIDIQRPSSPFSLRCYTVGNYPAIALV